MSLINSLIHLIEESSVSDDNEETILKHSSYYDFESLKYIKQISYSNLLLLSLNCQSISNKFAELKISLYR